MDVRLPDGTVIKGVPEGTTKAQLVEKLTRNGYSVPAEWMSEAKPRVDPTEGMSTAERFLAGAGKGMVDLARGVGQRVGLVDQSAIDAAKELDAPLMRTGAGKAGAVAGNVAVALPAALVPGANTVAGAAMTGGVMGALQPTATGESVAENTLTGAAGGVGGLMLGRGLAGLYQGGKALLQPFTQSGRERIAGNVLSRFADDASRVNSATSTPTMTGARPTLAEQTGDVGIARLQDALRSLDPQINNALSSRLAENNAARVNALQSLAGDSTKRAAAEASRAGAARPLYEQAIAKDIAVDDTLKALMGRPSVQKALGRAQSLAAEEGRQIGDVGKTVTGQTLQDLKMGLDALLKDPTSGIAGQEARSIKATRDALVSWMENAEPAFKAARTTYAEKSKPLNAMDLGEYVARKATSNTSDLAGNPRMQANALLGALRDEAGLVQKGTGRKELNALSQVLDPQQEALLRAVASESDRAAAVASAGAGPGSATAQRMASQNILRSLVGPTGLPESWAESVVANTVVGKPLNLIYGGVAEPKIQQVLAQAVLDPDLARNVLDAAAKANVQIPPSIARQLISTAARQSVPASALVSGQR